MFSKIHFSLPLAALSSLTCCCTLALSGGIIHAEDATASGSPPAAAAAPTFLAIPSPASQLRPEDSNNAPAPAAPAPSPATLSFASDENPSAPMLPATSVIASNATTLPAPASTDAPSLAPDTTTETAHPPGPGELASTVTTDPSTVSTDSPSLATDTTPSASLPPGPAQDPTLAKSPILNSTGDTMTAPAPAPPGPPASSTPGEANAWKNSYVNLVNLLATRGILTKKDSHDLLSQAEHDAAEENSAKAQATAVLSSPAAPPNPNDDTMRVGYVPESVKEQMRDEIKADVLEQARDEHWAAPDQTPDWVKRYHVAADIRVRYEGQTFPDGNDNSGDFHNFNAVNTGSPFDTGTLSAAQNAPSYDVDQNRNRFRLRARVGADVDVGSGFTAGLRIATGSDNNPVTENQTFGAANNGQGGDFSKYSIWLDRAFLKYQIGDTLDQSFSATVGRFDNPFFATSMIWADDLAFDGLLLKGRYKVADGVTPFMTAGAFPVFNTDLNFGTYQGPKFASEDKYLYAAQTGVDWQISHDFSFKGAAAIYDYENIQGKVSDPFTPVFSTDSGNTDDSRPSFAQNGNTYIALRDIVPNASNGFGTINQFQYYGLATGFREAALTGQFDYSGFDPYHVLLIGEVVKNLAFDSNAIEHNGPPQLPGPVNNNSNGSTGTFAGGDLGYNLRLTVGHPTLNKLGDWNVNLTYRYVETDAVVDGFTDADFGGNLTGTNLQGYIIGGNVALSPRVWTSLRWMSSESIAGPTYKNDLIQLDINAKF